MIQSIIAMAVISMLWVVVRSHLAFGRFWLLCKITGIVTPVHVTSAQKEVGLALSQHGESAAFEQAA